jgi:hypothetical protein
MRLVRLIVLCMACAAIGAAAATWHAQQEAREKEAKEREANEKATAVAPMACVESPTEGLILSERHARAELERARLAIVQEEASRAALQKIADTSAEQVRRLETEIRVLKGPRTARP